MARFFKKAAAYCGGFLFCGIAALVIWLKLTEASPSDMPVFKEGDLVFITTSSSQSNAIMAVSQSAYTHTGIIHLQKDGAVGVLEAVQPVQLTPFKDFLARSSFKRITVKRIKNLSPQSARNATSWASRQIGKPYDLYFAEDDKSFYCSELVHDAYQKGANIRLGAFDVIGSLPLDFPPVKSLIEKRWKKYPACVDRKVKSFEACFEIIKAAHLVTPVSIANDDQLETLYSNYGFLG